MKWLTIVCAVLFGALSAFAQTAFQNFETIGVDEELSQNSVYGVCQDRRGFLWIGTADGLNRYDGKRIKKFRAPHRATEPYNANFIRGKIAEDKNENLWYYTENGLYAYSRARNQIEKKFQPPQIELRRVDFKVVLIDSLQRVWMFDPTVGFAVYSITTKEFKTIPVSPRNAAAFFPRDATQEGDNIWFGVNHNEGIYRLNTNTLRVDHFFANEDVALVQFKRGGYYKVGSNYIDYYDSVTKKSMQLPLKFTGSLQVKTILEDEQHRLWVATDGDGLWLYDLSTCQTMVYQNDATNKFSLASNHLTGLMMDNRKNLWVSTEGGGVCRLDTKPPLFKSSVVSHHTNLKTNLFVKAIAEDAEQNVWLGLFQNPIYVLNPHNGKISNPLKIEKLEINDVSAIVIDSKKNKWIGHGKFISKISPSSELLARGEFDIRHPFMVNKLIELKDGRMMAATSIGIIIISEQGNKLLAEFTIDTFAANDVHEDEDGIWVGSHNTGVFRYTKNKNGYQQQEVLFGNLDIKCIHFDKENPKLIWLATDRGLMRFDQVSKQSKLFTEVDGMTSSYVYSILEDSRGRLWCSTNSGINCFDKKANRFINYSSKDGLQSNEFNSGAFHEGASGNFYFGGIKGLNWLKPEDIDADTATAHAAITEMNVNEMPMNDSILQKKNIELPYFKNDASFQFSVFDFSKPEGNKIKYQLLNWDETPRVTYDLVASYRNLSPGNYTLVFSASTSNNKWSKEQRFAVVINPPFWQRWWFYAFIVLLITAIITLIIEYLIRQRYKMKIIELEKQNALERERRRISMEMHDDIGAHLTQITLMSEAAKHKSEKETSLEQIAQTSRKVVNAMSEIIWSLNPDNKTFEQLMSYVRDQLHNLLEPSGIKYYIELPESGNFLLSNAVKRNIILLFKEAVNNAIRHSRATEISVTGKFYSRKLEVEIKDNGLGFLQNNNQEGNGLKNMRTRVTEIKGEMRIDSGNNGTVVHFTIPITEDEYY